MLARVDLGVHRHDVARRRKRRRQRLVDRQRAKRRVEGSARGYGNAAECFVVRGSDQDNDVVVSAPDGRIAVSGDGT